ncbi:VOC family protein [Alkaliphilus sp. MSJ-5]|uniref:VOC family protein n=1 Tax=Alkaliphilus flagellatus TaxID=2841507 RepID=A0ABS6FX97_9FIRM|nr:VOC family protein [Alkaliphilus flagellatus]MBU5674844.1 VOC family protein [Alkaliphilus flagellatus]
MYKMDHVGVRIKDSKISTEFYCNILGCEVVGTLKNEERELIFLRAGDGVIELINKFNHYEERSAGVVDHIAFTVDNLDEAIKKLKESGVNILGDKPIQVTESMRVIFFEGPDRERLEFVEKR